MNNAMTEASGTKTKHPCGAPRADGQACTAPGLMPDHRCFAHSARATAADRARARRRGGQERGTSARLSRLMPRRLQPVYAQLETALSDVLAGELDPKQATAAAAVARAMVSVLTAGELEERVRKLEGGNHRA